MSIKKQKEKTNRLKWNGVVIWNGADINYHFEKKKRWKNYEKATILTQKNCIQWNELLVDILRDCNFYLAVQQSLSLIMFYYFTFQQNTAYFYLDIYG